MAGHFPVSLSYGVFITSVVAGTVESESSRHVPCPSTQARTNDSRRCRSICARATRSRRSFCDVIARACQRLRAHPASAKAKLDALIAAGAWIDAALALLELELPQWTLRRLVYDDGEWHCSLSKHPPSRSSSTTTLRPFTKIP